MEHAKMKAERDEAVNLLKDLDLCFSTAHLDMGGNNRYTIRLPGHKIIDKIKGFLYKLRTEPDTG